MADAATLHWKAFCDACCSNIRPCGDATRARLNPFRTRLRFATRLQNIAAAGYSEAARRHYAVCIRLLAAHSAAELLGEALECKVKRWHLMGPDLRTGCAAR